MTWVPDAQAILDAVSHDVQAQQIAARGLEEAKRARDLLEGFQAVIGQGCIEWEAKQVCVTRLLIFLHV